ncbi:hypothetical protein C8F04DRAFT_1173154 [Mycena alexandri]|uniref:Uncharacterized protein n=1 Tax=Mycena alexandri TaxID=1745969 RepID=A0AAD6TLV8_9AGAR|nr:hypothetical protein C8F04DRAFT_1173154 [Mycena alexandri]
MPDASTQTDLSMFDALEFKRTETIVPVEGKATAPLTDEKSLEYKREAIAHVEGKTTGPPTAGMMHWLGRTISRPHIASEFDHLSEAELLAHEELRKKKVAELLNLRKGYKERLRKQPYLHWRPAQQSKHDN